MHLPGVGRDLVEKPAIVGDDDEPARVRRPPFLEMLGEPGDALDVEVVGGLIEEDDVPVADEQLSEGHAPALATRQIAQPGRPGEVGEQPVDHVADLRVTRPLVLIEMADDHLRNGVIVAEHVGLVEHPDRRTPANSDAATIRFDASREEAEKRRLAVAVAPDDTDAVTFVNADSDAVEDDARRILEVKGLGSQ